MFFERHDFAFEQRNVFASVVVHKLSNPDLFKHCGAFFWGAFGFVERNDAPCGEVLFSEDP